MSLKINWNKINTIQNADLLKNWINNKIHSVISLPPFVLELEVSELYFGEEPPLIELIDVSSPVRDLRAVPPPLTSDIPNVETKLKIEYAGNAHITINMVLGAGWEGCPNFVALPVKVEISNFDFEAVVKCSTLDGFLTFSIKTVTNNQGESFSPLNDLHVKPILGDSTQGPLCSLSDAQLFLLEQLRKLLDQCVEPNSVTLNLEELLSSRNFGI